MTVVTVVFILIKGSKSDKNISNYFCSSLPCNHIALDYMCVIFELNLISKDF